MNVIVTPTYGTSASAATNIDINQGRINKISEWGILTSNSFYPGIANFHWTSDEQTSFNDDYGWAGDSDIDECNTYTLSDDDYIRSCFVFFCIKQSSFLVNCLTFFN